MPVYPSAGFVKGWGGEVEQGTSISEVYILTKIVGLVGRVNSIELGLFNWTLVVVKASNQIQMF